MSIVGEAEAVVHREEHTHWLSCDKQSVLKTYRDMTVHELNGLYSGICVDL